MFLKKKIVKKYKKNKQKSQYKNNFFKKDFLPIRLNSVSLGIFDNKIVFKKSWFNFSLRKALYLTEKIASSRGVIYLIFNTDELFEKFFDNFIFYDFVPRMYANPYNLNLKKFEFDMYLKYPLNNIRNKIKTYSNLERAKKSYLFFNRLYLFNGIPQYGLISTLSQYHERGNVPDLVIYMTLNDNYRSAFCVKESILLNIPTVSNINLKLKSKYENISFPLFIHTKDLITLRSLLIYFFKSILSGFFLEKKLISFKKRKYAK